MCLNRDPRSHNSPRAEIRIFYTDDISHSHAARRRSEPIPGHPARRSPSWEHLNHPAFSVLAKKLVSVSTKMNLQSILSEQADTLGCRIWKTNSAPYPRWSAVRIKQAEPFKVDDCGNLPRGAWRWTLRGSVRKGAQVGLTSGVGGHICHRGSRPPHMP